MDKSGVGGVALPLLVLESNTNQEHLSASVQRNQDKKEVTKEKKWANVLETNTQTENWKWQFRYYSRAQPNEKADVSVITMNIACFHFPAESYTRGLIPRRYLSVEYEATASS